MALTAGGANRWHSSVPGCGTRSPTSEPPSDSSTHRGSARGVAAENRLDPGVEARIDRERDVVTGHRERPFRLSFHRSGGGADDGLHRPPVVLDVRHRVLVDPLVELEAADLDAAVAVHDRDHLDHLLA